MAGWASCIAVQNLLATTVLESGACKGISFCQPTTNADQTSPDETVSRMVARQPSGLALLVERKGVIDSQTRVHHPYHVPGTISSFIYRTCA